jgi:hypothetical protein
MALLLAWRRAVAIPPGRRRMATVPAGGTIAIRSGSGQGCPVRRRWEQTPRQSIQAECSRRGADAVVSGCIDVLNGSSVDEHLLGVLAGPAARSVIDGADGGLTGYWPRVWALRGLLYAWSDGATPALMGAFDDQSWRVREMAARVVAKQVVGEAFDHVVRLQHDETPRVSAAASRAVAALVDHQA